MVGSNALGHAYVVSLAQVFDQINLCFGGTDALARFATPRSADDTSPKQESCDSQLVAFESPDEGTMQSDTASSSDEDGHMSRSKSSALTNLASHSILEDRLFDSTHLEDDQGSFTTLTSPASSVFGSNSYHQHQTRHMDICTSNFSATEAPNTSQPHVSPP